MAAVRGKRSSMTRRAHRALVPFESISARLLRPVNLRLGVVHPQSLRIMVVFGIRSRAQSG